MKLGWHISGRHFSGRAFGLAGALLLTPAAMVMAQPAPATVHGAVKDPTGAPLSGAPAEVRFSTDKSSSEKDRKYQYTFPVSPDATYKATGVAPGDYIVFVFQGDKSIDFQDLTVKAGADDTLDFDLSRPEYLKTLTAEQRAQIEAVKKKNAAAIAENSQIKNLNALLISTRQLEKTDPDKAVATIQPATTMRPNEPIVWASLAEAQLAAADAAAKAAGKTATPDPAVVQKYADAATSYQKAVDLIKAQPKPNNELLYSCELNLGQAFGKSGKTDEAAKAYDAAAAANPPSAGKAYFNEAATLYNASKMDEAAAAAEKAIQADPKNAEAYYIKGQALIPKATMDSKTNKIVLPPGCFEAYEKYLDLAPTGSHVTDVRAILDNADQAQHSSYKAGRKS